MQKYANTEMSWMKMANEDENRKDKKFNLRKNQIKELPSNQNGTVN